MNLALYHRPTDNEQQQLLVYPQQIAKSVCASQTEQLPSDPPSLVGLDHKRALTYYATGASSGHIVTGRLHVGFVHHGIRPPCCPPVDTPPSPRITAACWSASYVSTICRWGASPSSKVMGTRPMPAREIRSQQPSRRSAAHRLVVGPLPG